MRLAVNYDRIHNAGAEIIAISVDDEVRHAAFAKRWDLSLVRFESDPGGDLYLKALDLFDPEAKNGLAISALIVLAPNGTEVFRYKSEDFADRTADEEMLQALEGLGLDPVDPPAWQPDVAIPDDLDGFYPTNDLDAYMKGNFFGSMALGRRIEDPEAKAALKAHQMMAKDTIDAIAERENQ